MTVQEIEALDIRNSAIHECGHAFVGRHYKLGGAPSIWKNEDADPVERTTWQGTTQYCNLKITPMKHRRIAIAGIVAEMIEELDPLEDLFINVLESQLDGSYSEVFEETEGWSLTDWQGAQGWTSRDFYCVVRILRRNWKNLILEAERLIELGIEDGYFAKDPEEYKHLWALALDDYHDMEKITGRS